MVQWNQESIERLTELFNQGLSDKEIGIHFGLTAVTIEGRRLELGLLRRKQYRQWSTKEEMNLVRWWSEGVFAIEVAKRLGRTRAAVSDKIYKLKLENPKTLRRKAQEIPDGMKYCPRCECVVTLSEFYDIPTADSGRAGYCNRCSNQISREFYQSIRRKCLRHIGDQLRCAHCNEDDFSILQVDHKQNDGYLDLDGLGLYRSILTISKQEAQKYYQILCANCNWKKRIEVQRQSDPMRYQLNQIRRSRVLNYLKADSIIKCTSCGIDDIDVIQIDHIHNDGNQEKSRGLREFYPKILSLSQDEAQSRFQLLCANCNWKKQLEQSTREVNE